VYLHIASPKTGTTYLQGVLWRNRGRLKKQGLLLPGSGLLEHYEGCFQVREVPQSAPDPARGEHAWDRLVEKTLAWDGDVLISHEMYCLATKAQAQRAIAPLVEAGREVHIIITARDLARQITADWQERVKIGGTVTFEEFVERMRRRARDTGNDDIATTGGGYMWRAHDYDWLAERWGSTLPPEHTHVVTVPPRGAPRDLLWQRYAGLLGIDSSDFEFEAFPNESLGVEQVELIRRLNVELDGRIRWPRPYSGVVKQGFAEQILGKREGTRLELRGEDLAFAREASADVVRRLRARGVDAVGDLDELLVPEVPADGTSTARMEVSTERLLEEALGGIAGLLDRAAEERMAFWAAQGQDTRPQGDEGPPPPPVGRLRRFAVRATDYALRRLLGKR